MEIRLKLPFKGKYRITFGFGAVPGDKKLQEKFKEWGIVGHNGIDYGLAEGSGVLAAAGGLVIWNEEKGDFGICVILEHEWGKTYYAHLKEVKVKRGQIVETRELLGLSGKTGSATACHLHFGIKPKKPDFKNGYQGFIDPLSYFRS